MNLHSAQAKAGAHARAMTHDTAHTLPTDRELLRVAGSLPGWHAGLRSSLERELSALTSVAAQLRFRGPLCLGPGQRARGDVVVSLVHRVTRARCAWLELEGPLARALVDLAIGGTADAAELALVEPLDCTRSGVLLYLLARLLREVPGSMLCIEGIEGIEGASDAAPDTRIACAVGVTLAQRDYGAHVTVDPAALPRDGVEGLLQGELAPWWSERACTLAFQLARGVLRPDTLAALAPGDVLIPEEIFGTPRAPSTRLYLPEAELQLGWVEGPEPSRGCRPEVALSPERAVTTDTAEPPVAFSIESKRWRARYGEVLGILKGTRELPPAPESLTLFSEGHALARGTLVRVGDQLGFAVERARSWGPNTQPYAARPDLRMPRP